MKRLAYRLAHVLLVISIPVFLITTSLRIVINSDWMYETEFNRYSISIVTRISQADLLKAARELTRFFNQPGTPLGVQVRIAGIERELFNTKEKSHMEDVRNLVQGVYRWQLLSVGYIVLYSTAALLASRGRAFKEIASGIFKGALATVGLLLALGVGSLVGFDALFLQFHLLVYSNDLWILDPRTDYLIAMFPGGFFLDATLLTAGIAAAGAIILGLIAWVYLLLQKTTRANEAAAVKRD